MLSLNQGPNVGDVTKHEEGASRSPRYWAEHPNRVIGNLKALSRRAAVACACVVAICVVGAVHVEVLIVEVILPVAAI